MSETWVEELITLMSARELSLESITAAQIMRREHFRISFSCKRTTHLAHVALF